jgi:hypothetical protein
MHFDLQFALQEKKVGANSMPTPSPQGTHK